MSIPVQFAMANAVLGDRSLFPELDASAYLAHAAIAPLSAPVVERMTQVASSYARGGMVGFAEWAPQLDEVRERLARLIGASPREIGFVSNTSHGVIDIAFGLRWRTGERVVLFEGEFPANVTPWQQAAEEFGLELCWQSLEPFHRSTDEGLAALEQALERGIRLVALSAVQYKTGLRMPVPDIAALCHRYEAELFVDAIQALGATPLHVSSGVDYLSSGSHKHLMGPEGGGFVYVAERCASRCLPRLAGWLSHEDAAEFLMRDQPKLRYDKPLKAGARAFEIGTGNTIGLAALGASVELLEHLGAAAIHAHVNRYLDLLEPALVERGFSSYRSSDDATRSTLLSVSVPDGVRPTELSKKLKERGVVCNTPDGLIRFSPHWPNHLDEVSDVLDAIDETLTEIRRAP